MVAGFLYYLPDRQQVPSFEDLKTAGLGYAFDVGADADQKSLAHRGVQGGPDGGKGILVASVSADQRAIGYHPDRQTWRKLAGKSQHRVWVGHDKENPPAPADLVRAELLPGHEVKLADGHHYTIPVARGIAAGDNGELSGWYHALPRSVDLDDAGQWTYGDVLPRYRWLWELALGWFDVWWEAFFRVEESETDGEQEDDSQGPAARGEGRDSEKTLALKLYDLSELATAATAVLAANYRVGKTEVVMLGLFDGEGPMREILGALIDWPFVVSWFKKKADADSAAASSTGNGPPDGPPATGPP